MGCSPPRSPAFSRAPSPSSLRIVCSPLRPWILHRRLGAQEATVLNIEVQSDLRAGRSPARAMRGLVPSSTAALPRQVAPAAESTYENVKSVISCPPALL